MKDAIVVNIYIFFFLPKYKNNILYIQTISRYFGGGTESRTRTPGFKVLFANHYNHRSRGSYPYFIIFIRFYFTRTKQLSFTFRTIEVAKYFVVYVFEITLPNHFCPAIRAFSIKSHICSLFNFNKYNEKSDKITAES